MTPADESREEFIQERYAMLEADGIKYDAMQVRRDAILAWERIRASLRGDNASGRHGEGAGAIGGGSVGGTEGAG